MGIKIELGFDFDDEVFIVNRKTNTFYEKCVACDGVGKAIYGGNSFTCDKCKGKGKRLINNHSYSLLSLYVSSVEAFTDNEIIVMLSESIGGRTIYEKAHTEIYTDEEKCKKVCDEYTDTIKKRKEKDD